MYRTVFWTLWEKERVGWFNRTAWKHVYYLGWNRSPAQYGCMRQALRPGALGRPRGIRWRGRWERGSGWGTHVNQWLINFNVLQNPLQFKKKSDDAWLLLKIDRNPNITVATRKGPWVSRLTLRIIRIAPSSHEEIPEVLLVTRQESWRPWTNTSFEDLSPL